MVGAYHVIYDGDYTFFIDKQSASGRAYHLKYDSIVTSTSYTAPQYINIRASTSNQLPINLPVAHDAALEHTLFAHAESALRHPRAYSLITTPRTLRKCWCRAIRLQHGVTG